MFHQPYDDINIWIYTSIKGFWMKKTWFLISCNLELNCKSYKRNRKLCFKNKKWTPDFTVHSSYRLSARFYCSFVVSSVRKILLFIHRIVCPYDFTVHSSYRLSVRIYCSFVVSSVFLLFIVCCHFLLIRGKIYISRSRHYFGNSNGQNLDLCVGNLLYKFQDDPTVQ